MRCDRDIDHEHSGDHQSGSMGDAFECLELATDKLKGAVHVIFKLKLRRIRRTLSRRRDEALRRHFLS